MNKITMASKSIRIRTSYRDGVTTVRSIIRHPMETGFSRDTETSEVIPAHFIQEVVCKHGEKVILRCDWSRAVSKNPYLSFIFSGAKPGDTISIYWIDIKGESDIAKAVIK